MYANTLTPSSDMTEDPTLINSILVAVNNQLLLLLQSPLISMNTPTTTQTLRTIFQSPAGTILYVTIAVFVVILLYISQKVIIQQFVIPRRQPQHPVMIPLLPIPPH
jgi:hypothetical protein